MIPTHILANCNTIRYIKNQTDFDNLAIPPNSTIRFKKGETFYGNLVINEKNITIDSYGTGSKPVITGSVDISTLNWTDEGGNIWSSITDEPLWVVINNELAKLSEVSGLTISARSGANKLTVNTAPLLGFTNIIGSYCVIKLVNFRTGFRHLITDWDSGTGVITLDSDTLNYPGYSGIGYPAYIYNDIEFFNGYNEWAYRSGKLYIHSTVSPETLNIRAISKTIGIMVSSDSVSINNIEIKEFHTNLIQRISGDNLAISNCDLHESRGYGILTNSDENNLNINNCEIYNCKGGICDFATKYPVIHNNYVHNYGLQETLSWMESPLPTEGYLYQEDCGICIFESDLMSPLGAFVYSNEIDNGSYNGFKIKGSNGKIYKNIINNACQRMDDGGWLYCNGSPSKGTWFENNEIYNNILTGYSSKISKGIYFDNNARNNNVHHNLMDVYTSYETLDQSDDTYANTFEDNLFIQKGPVGLKFFDNLGYSTSRNINNVLNRNIIASKHSNSFLMNFLNSIDSYMNPFIMADYNYFINPFKNQLLTTNDLGAQLLSDIQTNYSNNQNSIEKLNWLTYVNAVTADEQVKLYINYTDINTTIIAPSGYEDIDGNDVSNQELTVPAHYGLLILKS
jgi:hypothetical protein